jgi:hypothetical protein
MGVVRIYQFEATCDSCGKVVRFESNTIHTKRQAFPEGWAKLMKVIPGGKKFKVYCETCLNNDDALIHLDSK